MKNITRFMRSISKRTYAVAAVAVAAVAIPASLFAWGPANRVTFTLEKPADYVTFNSMTNNAQYGDERDFVQVRNVTDNTQYGENTALTPGKEYEVFAYYHNNASTSLNDAAHNYAGVATGAFMRTQMPSTVAANGEARITSFVGATNAKHLDASGTNLGNQVWDEAFGKNATNSAIALSYVSGSAKITSKGAVNGKTLPDSLFSTGTALGYSALDGKLPGCLEFSGYVTYRFKVDQPNFTVAKTVSAHEANSYVENVSTTTGSTVDFKIKYQNTGTTTQHATIRDQLPAGLEYIAGSTYYSSSLTNNQWKAAGYDTVTNQGLGLGAFAPGAAGYVKFSAKVVTADKLACGPNTLTNTAAADTENGSKSDTASVSVNKECIPPKEIEVCRLADKKIVTIKETEYDQTKYSKNLDDCRTIEVCRLADKTVVTITKSEYTANPSKYSTNLNDCKEVPVMIEVCRLADKKIVTIDQKDFDTTKYSKNLDDCREIQACRLADKTVVTITKSEYNANMSKYSLNLNDCKPVTPEKIQVCRLSDKTVITIDAKDFDQTKHSKNLDDCKPVVPEDVQVCRLSDKTVVTITKTEYNANKDKYSTNLNDCKEVVPNKVQVCRLTDKQIVTIDEKDFDGSIYSKDLNDCKTPETPVELPHTGITDGVMSALGLSSLVAATSYYRASRKSLQN